MASTSEFVIAASNETNAMTKWLSDALTQDVMARHIDVPQYKEIPVALSAKTPSGSLVGALVGRLAWQTLYIQLLATNVDIRAPSGTGACLLRAIEEIAREHQCTHLLLETYSWQARGFYEKLGFCVLGELRHNPPGHSKFMMEKLLTGDRKAAPMVASPAISVEVSTAEEMSPFLFDWLQRHTDRLRLSPPVPPYAKKFAAAECRLQHDNSTVVGGCVYQTLWAELQIRYFAVLPAYRGRGVGTRLLEYMEDVARSERCTQLIIHITSWQAWRWFLRKGFVEFGREKDYPPSHSRLYLVKHLHQVHI